MQRAAAGGRAPSRHTPCWTACRPGGQRAGPRPHFRACTPMAAQARPPLAACTLLLLSAPPGCAHIAAHAALHAGRPWPRMLPAAREPRRRGLHALVTSFVPANAGWLKILWPWGAAGSGRGTSPGQANPSAGRPAGLLVRRPQQAGPRLHLQHLLPKTGRQVRITDDGWTPRANPEAAARALQPWGPS